MNAPDTDSSPAQTLAGNVRDNVQQVIVGNDEAIDHVLIASKGCEVAIAYAGRVEPPVTTAACYGQSPTSPDTLRELQATLHDVLSLERGS